MSELFDRFAAAYDASRRQLVPGFDAFYGTAVEVAALRAPSAARVLDVGAGTGLLSLLLSGALPQADFLLLDAAPAMLEQAVTNLAGHQGGCRTIVSDFGTGLPDGPFDIVVSALAIHHLDDGAKRRLYQQVHDRLTPGGVFVNADQTAGPDPALDQLYEERWLAHTEAAGVDPAALAAARERMLADRPAPVEAQLGWLRDVGFESVDCFFKQWRFAVFGGWRR